jgi:NAD(P)-dependent dehydrogenase (short-subunit alcohol dehydrogenase family)
MEIKETSLMNLQGKTVMVSGATNGIGKEAAMTFANMGAEVVIIGRNKALTESTVAEIKEKTGNQKVDQYIADLSSQSDIRRVAAEFLSSGRPLHVLLNNAGAYITNDQKSVDGIEMTWALNHLGYFLLTELLLDRMKGSAPARIVNVSSGAHKGIGKFDLEKIESGGGYKGFKAYSASKLANILFTMELANCIQGKGISVNCLHPGFVASQFGKSGPFFKFIFIFLRPFLRSRGQGLPFICVLHPKWKESRVNISLIARSPNRVHMHKMMRWQSNCGRSVREW